MGLFSTDRQGAHRLSPTAVDAEAARTAAAGACANPLLDTLADLLRIRRADQALYQAKQAERDRAAFAGD